jgi:hypothetical protein
MRIVWICLGIFLIILTLLAVSFGITTAVLSGSGKSWDDYITMTLVLAIFIACGIAVVYYIVKGYIKCCQEITTSVDRDHDQAHQPEL